jgi:hypothetical protein
MNENAKKSEDLNADAILKNCMGGLGSLAPQATTGFEQNQRKTSLNGLIQDPSMMALLMGNTLQNKSSSSISAQGQPMAPTAPG